jgi:hypothetical protein
MKESRGAGPLDRLLMGAGAIACENNGTPYAALIDVLNFIGVTITYHAPGEGQSYGLLDVELVSPGTVAWSAVTGKPTTVADSGIADAVATARTITCTAPLRIDGAASKDMTANRTLSILPASASQNGYMSKEDFAKLAAYPAAPDVLWPQWNDGSNLHYPLFIDTTSVVLSFVGETMWVDLPRPIPQWVDSEEEHRSPEFIAPGAGIEIDWDGYGLQATIKAGGELKWSAWSSPVTVHNADTSVDVATYALTDLTRASEYWMISVDIEVVCWIATSAAQTGAIIARQNYHITYNGSGVPSIGDLGGNDARIEWGNLAACALVTGHSNPNIYVRLTKSSGGSDFLAKCRIRKSFEVEVT